MTLIFESENLMHGGPCQKQEVQFYRLKAYVLMICR